MYRFQICQFLLILRRSFQWCRRIFFNWSMSKLKKKTWNNPLLISVTWDKGDKNHINQRHTPTKAIQGSTPSGQNPPFRNNASCRSCDCAEGTLVSNCCQSSSKKKKKKKLWKTKTSVSVHWICGRESYDVIHGQGSQQGFHSKYIEKAFGTVEPRNKNK